jgi:hypothetical protein
MFSLPAAVEMWGNGNSIAVGTLNACPGLSFNNSMANPSEDYPAQTSPVELIRIETEISELRNQISDLGSAVDRFKAKRGGAIGGGVFLALLGLITAYDFFSGKSNLWLSVGVSREMLKFVAIGLAGGALLLFLVAAVLEKRRDRLQEARLAELEQELEGLLIRKSALESG